MLATVTGLNPQLSDLEVDGDAALAHQWMSSITTALPAPIVTRH
jgi:hypothetical protein